ncbi:MAG: folylpolyglutamate synthase/dihydrofolate synthase family protein [Dehalococcoidia bacterium]
MPDMDFRQAIDYINGYTDYEKVGMPHDPAFYDLRRVDELLSWLGDPQKKAAAVHITGTNGKGSVAVMTAGALTAAGYTSGLYTSPHLHSWRERIRVDGELISEAGLAQMVSELKPHVEAVNQRARYGELTTFEFLTCLAFTYFGQKKVDFQVLEVGMGGKFDATSVINPLVAVITTIGLDHTDVLGDTVAQIAAEKCGIIKPGSSVVVAPQPPEAYRVIEKTCTERGVELITVGKDVKWRPLQSDLDGQRFSVAGRRGGYELFLPVLGEHQIVNAATAVAALEVIAEKGFRIPNDKIAEGFKQVEWPGRFQVLRRQPPVIVDGAHNIDAARSLKKALKEYFSFDKAVLVMGASGDKNIAAVIAELAPLFDRVIVTRSRHPRAMAPAPLAAEFARHGLKARIADDVPAALSMALDMAGDKDLVCLAGSLFIVGEALTYAASRLKDG